MSSSQEQEPGIEVRSYFPTPVVVARVPLGEDDNARLRELILAREKTDPGVHHSNLLGWQSADDFTQWGGGEGEKLLGFAKALADRLAGDRAGNRVAVTWFVNAWANINRRGHANDSHAHPGSVFSGCYYVDDGGISDDPTLGGAFQINDPRGILPAMYAPELAVALSGCQTAGGSEIIPPRTGQMLLFPAWLAHGVRPYLGDGTRISIAFNFAIPMAGTDAGGAGG
ncbi:MAG: 2OG-Fe(II) oxygenase family protein [Alphaproteobacteria bacterium]|nr:2OG-Fe(II) oxygenase family protein [Alphaproteobacteria bacterium]